jgi:hypothetical protein
MTVQSVFLNKLIYLLTQVKSVKIIFRKQKTLRNFTVNIVEKRNKQIFYFCREFKTLKRHSYESLT